MSSMIGIFDADKMDHVWPMDRKEQSDYLERLRTSVDTDELDQFLWGIVLTSVAYGYNQRLDHEQGIEDDEDY